MHTPKLDITWGADLEVHTPPGPGERPKSKYGPAATWWPRQARLYLAYRGASTEKLYYLWREGDSWSEEIDLSHLTGHAYESRLAPALAIHDDELVLVFGGKSFRNSVDDQNLYWSKFDGDRWTPPERIGSIGSHESAEAPALAAFQGLLHLVYRGPGHSGVGEDRHLYHCTFDGTAWTDGTRIEGAGYESDQGVGLAAFNERLYVVYTGLEKRLGRYGSFDGTRWSASEEIDGWNYVSERQWAAASAGGRLWVAYCNWVNPATDQKDAVRYGAFDGTRWIDSREVHLGGWSRTESGPALCALPGERLALAHRGRTTEHLWTIDGAFEDRNYADVRFLVAHNSFSNPDEGFLVNFQQDMSVLNQLRCGVRGISLDVYHHDGALFLCHGKCWLGNHPLIDTLREIRGYMDRNPDTVVTLFIESGGDFDFEKAADCVQFTNALRAAGLDQMVFSLANWTIPADQVWPSVGWMLENGRLVVLTQDTPYHDFLYLLRMWNYTVETVYGYESVDPATWTDKRSESKPIDTPTIPLFTMNHFPAGDDANAYDRVMAHVEACRKRWNRTPSFISVDHFQDGPDGGPRRVVSDLNLLK